MQNEKLRTTVSELELQLRALDTVDAASRQSLLNAVQEIRVALEDDRPAEVPAKSLIASLTKSVEHFEVSHPTLTSVLGRLIDILGQMGI
jgi:signal transduction histidine kinase